MAYRILIAPDKFKGSLNAFEVCDAIEKGLLAASSSFEIIKLPMADGGDGLSEVIAHYTGATIQEEKVFNPLFQPIQSSWLLSADGQTAFIEMAKASGLQLLEPSQYYPSQTSTYGTGQLIKAAIDNRVKEIIIGIGGSATNDGGIGMAAALGYRFLDKDDKELNPIGDNLIHIKKIDATQAYINKNIQFKIACDVKNTLCGPDGATRVYALQKGAGQQEVEDLEKGMLNYMEVLKQELSIDVSGIKGGGAAGGLGAGSVAFLKAQLISGIDLVMGYSGIREHTGYDLLITGEGKIDEQTLQGKVVTGVAGIGKKQKIPVIALCGTLAIERQKNDAINVTATFSIINKPMSLADALTNAAVLLTSLSYNIGAMIIKDKLPDNGDIK
jgi:glycerate kinase